MSSNTPDINDVLRGTYKVDAAEVKGLAAAHGDNANLTEELEARARARIGGSIAFVTRLKKENQDPLFFDGED